MTFQTPGGRSIHLSDGEVMESEAIYLVHIWHASCILQRSAMLMSYCVVKEWKMVNFKLGETKLCENWINQHVTGVGQGKKINKERKKVIEINTPKCSLKNCNLRFLTIDNFLQKKTCRFVFDCLNGATCFPFRNYFQRFHHNSLNSIETMGKQQNYPSI